MRGVATRMAQADLRVQKGVWYTAPGSNLHYLHHFHHIERLEVVKLVVGSGAIPSLL